MRPADFYDIEKALLVALLKVHKTNPNKLWLMEEIAAHAHANLTNDLMRAVAEHWREEGSVTCQSIAGLVHVRLLPTGMDRARNLLRRPPQTRRRNDRNRTKEKTTRGATGTTKSRRPAGRASSSTPSNLTVAVPIGSRDHRRAVDKVEHVVEAMRGYNAEWPKALGNKDQVIAELSAGRQLLNSALVRRSHLKRLLHNVLRRIADKFLDHAIGIAATAALAALAALFGGSFH